MARKGTAAVPMSATRRLVTLVALLAFFLQGLAVQTHIHPLRLDGLVKVQLSEPAIPSPLKSQDQDQSSCRLCQELTHAGVFVPPALASLLVSLAFIPAVLSGPSLPAALLAPAFSWQGRAPPRR